MKQDNMEKFIVCLDGVADELCKFIEPVLRSEGYELIWIEVVNIKKHNFIKLFVDKINNDLKINLNNIKFLHKFLCDFFIVLFNEKKIFQYGYNLEVSSPGVNRPLSKITHFNDSINRLLSIKTVINCNFPSKIKGLLISVKNNGIELKSKMDINNIFIDFKFIFFANIIWSI